MGPRSPQDFNIQKAMAIEARLKCFHVGLVSVTVRSVQLQAHCHVLHGKCKTTLDIVDLQRAT